MARFLGKRHCIRDSWAYQRKHLTPYPPTHTSAQARDPMSSPCQGPERCCHHHLHPTKWQGEDERVPGKELHISDLRRLTSGC